MTVLHAAVGRFLEVLRRRIEAEPANDPGFIRERDALLSLWPAPDDDGSASATRAVAQDLAPVLAPVLAPACGFLPAALDAACDGPEPTIGETLLAIAPALAWGYGYPADPRRPDLPEAVAFADIAGKQGLVTAPGIGIGLTLIAPETVYPSHAHPAVEFYLVLSGTAAWTAGADVAAARPPGSLILHPESIPHAMATGREPLLAIFTWHGDIASQSAYLD